MEPVPELPALRPANDRLPAEILRIAHRGAGGAERYGASDLKEVAAQGAHLVEFDLHVTKDDHLVARHNPRINMDGRTVWLADQRLTEVHDALERDGSPTVASIVRAAREARLGLYADIKTLTRRSAERLADLLETEAMATHTILASVRSDIILCCTQVAPHIPSAVLFSSTLEEPVQLAKSIGAQFVHPCWESQPAPDQLLEGPWIERVRANDLGVICWHEERPELLRRLCDIGVDGICTDDPGLLTQVALSRKL
jgi:glycerophosphoryl diester phosphodiesterase